MNSYGIIRNAINLKKIERIPVIYTLLGESDVAQFLLKNPKNWKPKKTEIPFDLEKDLTFGRETGILKEDEWGCTWEVSKNVYGIGNVIENPLKDLDLMKSYKFPDPDAPGRFKGLEDFININKDKYIIATYINCLFERLHFLHGFTETLIDLKINLVKIENLLDIIVDFQVRLIRNLGEKFKGKVHAYWTTDDWGTQTNLFIKPDLWRKVFKPRYKYIIEEAHKYNIDFWLHSDGNLTDIIEELIEIGVDVFDFPQPSSIYGIKEFGKRFAGKACFLVYLDIQTTGIKGTKEEIIKEAEEIVNYWSIKNGSGIIATDYSDIESIGANLEMKKVALATFKVAFNKKVGISK